VLLIGSLSPTTGRKSINRDIFETFSLRKSNDVFEICCGENISNSSSHQATTSLAIYRDHPKEDDKKEDH